MKLKIKFKTPDGSYTKKVEFDELNSDLNISQSTYIEHAIDRAKSELKDSGMVISTSISIETDWE